MEVGRNAVKQQCRLGRYGASRMLAQPQTWRRKLQFQARAEVAGRYRCAKRGERFSTNAAMPSFWSAVANSE
jgi:hypothetical protein